MCPVVSNTSLPASRLIGTNPGSLSELTISQALRKSQQVNWQRLRARGAGSTSTCPPRRTLGRQQFRFGNIIWRTLASEACPVGENENRNHDSTSASLLPSHYNWWEPRADPATRCIFS